MSMPSQQTAFTVNRRNLLKNIGAAGAAAAILPATSLVAGPAFAQEPQGDIVMRPIPRTGEMVPAIGLGTFMTFDVTPGSERAKIGEVVRLFWEAGGRMFDTSPLYGMSEVNLGDFASALQISDDMFITNKIWSTGDYLADDSHAERSLKVSMERLWRERIDAMQCHSLVNAEIVIPLLAAWKKEERIRFAGASHHDPAYFEPLATWVESGRLDFVQVHYSIHTRKAEERVLRAAADQGVAVVVNMPLEKARLHKIVAGRPLPDFAADLGIENWSQFFLKWVIAHPAVTCAIPATSNPEHVLENVGAMRGELPDKEMRARMVAFMEDLPGFAELDEKGAASWYPDKNYNGLVGQAQAELRERT
ncbi:aldo/keto reductase [Mesorhizobium escarrei]|uniref:Twin-arginine translocation pathway signal n=1 Tax=Mesorhizobium escarrei TaxID=666018 RepID=A0ABM9E7V1_9HYPH|nr:aldo/keto reductase [Mesorhizobium escarrei]CAH2405177.1 Twin-arginine translocation pathway signal [Mesorhizobium escarrei]